MRLILTAHQFLPEHSAGTEVLTHSAAKELQRRGHEVTIFTGSPAKPGLGDERRFDCYEHDGLRVERFRYSLEPMGDQANAMEVEFDSHLVRDRFRQLLLRERPDVVHFFHLARISSSPIPVCRELGIPAFYTPTDFWCVCPTCQLRLPGDRPCEGPDPDAANCVRHLASFVPSAAARIASRMPAAFFRLGMVGARCLPGIHPLADMAGAMGRRKGTVVSRVNLLDAVLAPTRMMASVLERHGVLEEKLVHCPFGIAPTADPGPRRTVDGGKLRVGYIGTLGEHKGAHVLLSAVRGLPEEGLEVQVYGSPDDYPFYAERLRRMAGGDRRILFRGTFPNSRIGEVLAGLDLLVVPSLWRENAPLVVASAQASGCPVVASDVEGIAEAIRDGEDGLLFPAGDATALGRVLLRLAGDRPLLARLSAGCRPPRSIVDYVGQLEDVYGRFTRHAAAHGRVGNE